MNFIALYDESGQAQQAASALVNAGCKQDSVQVLREGKAPGDEQLSKQLRDWGFSDHDTKIVVRAIHHGRSLVCAQVADDFAEKARGVMRQHGSRTLQDIERELSQARGPGPQPGDLRTEIRSIPVVEESLTVSKRQVGAGSAQIHTTVSEVPAEKTVNLKEEHLNIERRSVDRPLSPEEAEAVFQERTEELTAMREEPVVRKEAHVTGEVLVEKTVSEHEETIADTVRRTEVHIDQKPPEPSQGHGRAGMP